MTRRKQPQRPPRVRVDMRVPEPLVDEVDRIATKYHVTRTDVFLRAVQVLLDVERKNTDDGVPEPESLDEIALRAQE